ncbi:stress up-regulated Nod 19 protein [Rhynchospora pubera]|uniref:Stress up-regulated Nod 19 protein n=1 Tax=Rhynchospora pubera TaxID=906938 RepID=A0AAV8AQY5_9POAL|nr:stress up-regulated Nod 19 protein [Rhynchospora pubera]
MHTELCLVLFSFLFFHNTEALRPPGVKTETFLSPPFYLKPGQVANKYYFNIPFPKGHIALKSFNGEVVDEYDNPIPLHETYLHHWLVERYYGLKGSVPGNENDLSEIILVRNSGLCKHTLGQYYGLGSETRKTDTWVPDPYGIVVGNPEEVPAGYEERWLLNVHAIDTRGVTDRLGCTECRCNLYNVTVDEYGHEIRANYTGGLYCCYDETQCKLREGFESVTRKLFLKYTVEWVQWEPRTVPVKVYILDVTDTGTGPYRCMVEYEVKECNSEERKNGGCIDTQTTRLVMPHGGDIIYGVAHQHSGGAGSALYGQDGRLLCTSIPSYGNGKEAGNEANYIVGMSTCYPKPGSVKIADGETLTLISNYSGNQMHTGVMGLFYILVAEEERPLPGPPKNMICFNSLLSWCIEMSVKTGAVFIAGATLISIATMSLYKLHRKNQYEALATARGMVSHPKKRIHYV